MKPTRLVFASLLASSLAAQAPVFVVDNLPGPGVDYTDLRLAMESAPEGSVLLLREGSHVIGNPFTPAFVLSGKSLHVVGDSNAVVNVAGNVTIQNLSAAQSFSWLNLDQQHSNGFDIANSYVNCATWPWYEAVVATPEAHGNALSIVNTTGALNSSMGAILNRSSFRGNSLPQFLGSAGVTATEVSVHAYDSVFQGGFSSSGPQSGSQLADMTLMDAYAFVSGRQPDGSVSVAASGSAAIDLIATEVSGPNPPPFPVVHDGPARSMASNTPVREGQAVQLEFDAPAGEIALLALSGRAKGGFWPTLTSSVLIDPSALQTQVMGVVPPSGTLVRSIPTPANLVNGGALLVYSQAAFVDLATFDVRLGGGSLVVVLDSMY